MNLQQAGIHYQIDILKLEEEWEAHSQMVINAATALADAERDRDIAEEYRKFVKAETALAVRANPENYIKGKSTDAAIDAFVETDDQCRVATKRLIEATHKKNLAQAAVLALEHKKRALTKLVDLWIHEYYSDSRKFQNGGRRTGLSGEALSRAQKAHYDAYRYENADDPEDDDQ